jgi:hypothetical protein
MAALVGDPGNGRLSRYEIRKLQSVAVNMRQTASSGH